MAEVMLIADDVLLEIFIRIGDCRSLLRCTAVCKHWYCVINSTQFRHQKQKHENENQLEACTLLFRHGLVHKFTVPLPYQYFSKESQILHQTRKNIIIDDYLDFLPWPEVRVLSVTGDLLLITRELGRDFLICNPFTKQWIELPTTPVDLTLVFGGFGHGAFMCENNKDQFRYRVMLIWSLEYDCEAYLSEFGVMTFSSEIGEWSPTKLIGILHDLNYDPPIVCNERLHWLSLDYETTVAYGITAFDPFRNAHHPNYIQFPLALRQDERQKNWGSIRLGVVQGRLRIAQFFMTRRKRVFSVKVWELSYDGDGTTWTLVHDFTKRRIAYKKFMNLIAFHPTNGNVLFMLFDNIDIYLYDIREDKMEKISQFPAPGYRCFAANLHNFPIVHPFWPTKIPPLPLRAS